MDVLLWESLPRAVEELRGENGLITFHLYSYDSPDRVLDHFRIISINQKNVPQAPGAKASQMEFQT